MDTQQVAETPLPTSAYIAALAPLQTFALALAQLSMPVAFASRAAASLSAVAVTACDTLRTTAPLFHSHVMSPMGQRLKSMGPNSRIMVEIRSLNGTDYRLAMDADMSLAEVRERIARDAGIPEHRQLMVVSEERARGGSLATLAKRLSIAFSGQKDLRSILISWVNFIFLPEAVNRELYGRGAISWVRTTSWWQQLQEAQGRVSGPGAQRIQVEMLGGQVLLVEAHLSATLAQFRDAVEVDVGIFSTQQRLICIESAGSGRLTALANSVLLGSLGAAKIAANLTRKASSSVLGLPRLPTAYTIQVRTQDGQVRALDVTGEMTIDQVRRLVQQPEDDGGGSPLGGSGESSPRPGRAVAEIVFPELPPPKPSTPQILRIAPT